MATSRAAHRTTDDFSLDLLARSSARHARPAVLPRALGVAGLATVTTVALLPSGSALAEPLSARDLERAVQQLDTQASLAVEEFNQAQQRVEEVERRAAAAAQQAAADQARLDEVRRQMADLVAAAYRRGGNERLLALVEDGDPQAFLDRASMLDRIAQSQADVLARAATARSRADARRSAAERELAALREAHDRLAERRQQVERALKAQQDLLAGLQEQERRRVEAARAAAEAPQRASRSERLAPGAGAAPAPAATYAGPASGRARVAVEEAHRQLGKPYRYGASGPDSFDCSGLTSWVWRAAGVALPRTSRDQYAQGRKVARADIQPGDLVYFGNPIHHVGIYIGDGQMISAPRTGDRVKIQAAFRSDFVGATRP